MEKSLFVRPDLDEKNTMQFSNSYYKWSTNPQMFSQPFLEANTLYLQNLKRKETPLQLLDYKWHLDLRSITSVVSLTPTSKLSLL